MTKRGWIFSLAGAATLGLAAMTTSVAAERPSAADVERLHASASGISDIGAARRRRAVSNAAGSNANASVPPASQPVYTRAPDQANPYYGTPQNFGYGIGDNSHNVIN